HEGLEARVGVWGDAAGTAPAVTSASRLSLRFIPKFHKILLNSESSARLRARLLILVGAIFHYRKQFRFQQSGPVEIHNSAGYPRNARMRSPAGLKVIFRSRFFLRSLIGFA
ncbi:MAG TPA: hypothetical protein VMS31_04925, partial [Pyrinomonadaceae bacterium]|nr:hypothetical protein [Pyrinomonadaceae bacterium]